MVYDKQCGNLPLRLEIHYRCACAELIASDDSHPSANISSLPASGQAGNAGSSLRVEQLPQNGVLWNLDRIVCSGLLHTACSGFSDGTL